VTTTPSRTSTAVLAASLLVSLLATACGGGGGGGGGGAASPTPSPTAGGGAASSDPSASAQASGVVASSAPSGGGGSGSSGAKTPPDDACSVITDTDVKGIFGGNVEPVPNDDDEDNSCSFAVTDGNGLVDEYAATLARWFGVNAGDPLSGGDQSAELREAHKQIKLLEQEAEVMRRAVGYLSRSVNPK